MSASKQISVRIPDDEQEAVQSLFRQFPSASPALIIRALLHSATLISIGNALNRHHAHKNPSFTGKLLKGAEDEQ